MKEDKTYSFMSDPSHGWLRVSVKLLQSLGLLNKISVYSYINGLYVYLEEDSDAGKFIDAVKLQHGFTPRIKAKRQVNTQSHIRGYNSYNVNQAIKILKDKYNYKVVQSA